MGRLDPYVELLSEFLERGALDAPSFQERFFERFKADRTDFPADEFRVLDRLFGDADAFEPDPALRDYRNLDEAEFRAAARDALAKLRDFGRPDNASRPGRPEPSF